MAGKDFFQTVAAKAGFAGEYEPLTETEFAAAPGAPYVPGDEGIFKNVPTSAGRTIQLLCDSPVYVETFQVDDAILRVPSGAIATNDAEDGRFYFIKNNGSGTDPDGVLIVETSTGEFIATIDVGNTAIIIHGEDDNWDTMTIAGVVPPVPGADGFGGSFRYTSNSGVPGGGTLFMSTGDSVRCSEAGDRLINDIEISGMSIRVDAADGGKSFQAQVLANPSGVSGPLTVLATLDLLPGEVSAGRNDLAVFVTAPTEIGVRIIKLAGGGGGSAFNKININVQVS